MFIFIYILLSKKILQKYKKYPNLLMICMQIHIFQNSLFHFS